MPDPSPHNSARELAFIYLQDSQRLIAAGKVQRWEVLKWAVTVNLALATVAITTKIGGWPLFGLFLFCVFVAASSMFLLTHYNRRITGARNSLDKIMNELEKEFPEIEEFAGKERYPSEPEKLRDYDYEETTAFNFIIGFSVLPAFVVWGVQTLSY